MKLKSPGRTLTLKQAADALGVAEGFVLTLTLTGAKRPADQGGELVEIDYAVAAGELTFTPAGVDRFRARCPVAEWVGPVEVEKRLGVRRGEVSGLVYTGIPGRDGRVVRLPVWVVGNREYVSRADLEAFAEEFAAWAERKAARDLKKKYTRAPKPAASE